MHLLLQVGVVLIDRCELSDTPLELVVLFKQKFGHLEKLSEIFLLCAHLLHRKLKFSLYLEIAA